MKYDSFWHCLPGAGTSAKEHGPRCPTRSVQLMTTTLGSVTPLLLWPRTQDHHHGRGARCLENAWECSHAVPLGPRVTERQAGDTLCLVTHSSTPRDWGSESPPPDFCPPPVSSCDVPPQAGRHPRSSSQLQDGDLHGTQWLGRQRHSPQLRGYK